MRIELDKPTKKETTFQASKNKNIEEYKTSDSWDSELDEEEANFVRKIKRGLGKHKGKVPFICFNYGKVGKFSSKFPYIIKKNEEYSSLKRYRNGKTEKKINFSRQKKSLYSNEDNISSNDSGNETEEIIFMGIET